MKAILLAAVMMIEPALAHDVYSGIKGKDGQLCCGGDGANPDCRRTVFRERGSSYEFRTPDGDWLPVPSDRITFLPLPGDGDDAETHLAHLCMRSDKDVVSAWREHGREDHIMATVSGSEVVFFCGFIPPGGM